MNLPKMLIIAGLILLFSGILLSLSSRIPGLDRLGKLPGDIRMEGKNFKFYFPIVTSLLLSVVLTLIFRFFQGIKK